jgi:hypothetical protein
LHLTLKELETKEASGLLTRKEAARLRALRKRQETRRQNGAHERALVRLQDWRLSPSGRAQSSLHLRLWRNPQPSPQQVREWAADYGRRAGLPAAAVWEIWRDELEECGLLGRGGPKPNEARHHRIDEWRVTWPRTRSGKVKAGFWDQAAAWETDTMCKDDPEAEGIDGDGLKRWYRKHTLTPGRCELAQQAAD